MNPMFEALAAPFPYEDIEWRAGATNKDKTKALALAYITSRAVMSRLDDVCGPENWKDMYSPGPDGGVMCLLSIRVGDEWITKCDGAENSNIEAVKGGLSDAFKRAAVKWGIGRYLYGLDGVWVTCEQRGNTTVLTGKAGLPVWALPAPKPAQKPAEKTNGNGKQQPPAEHEPGGLVETGVGLGADATEAPKMELETALKVTNSEGKNYGDFTNDELANMSIGIGKALAKKGVTQEAREAYQYKMDAIAAILYSRAPQAA